MSKDDLNTAAAKAHQDAATTLQLSIAEYGAANGPDDDYLRAAQAANTLLKASQDFAKRVTPAKPAPAAK